MRILVASTRGTGHFRPVLPFCPRPRATRATRSSSPGRRRCARRRSVTGSPSARSRSLRPSATAKSTRMIRAASSFEESMTIAMRELFVGSHGRAALPQMLRLVERWQPRTSSCARPASRLAARGAGLPGARRPRGHRALDGPARTCSAHRADPLDELRAEFGLVPTPAPRGRWPRRAHSVASRARRRRSRALTDAALPHDGGRPSLHAADWWNGSADPLVPISFGTVAPTEARNRRSTRTVIDALGDHPDPHARHGRRARGPGRARHPAALGPRRALGAAGAGDAPHRAMSTTAGGGTTLAALAAGVPRSWCRCSPTSR